MKQRYIALFAILLIFIIGCYFYYNRESPSAHFDKHIMDAIHQTAPNAFFEQADAYKYAQDYRRALSAFEKLLPQSKTAEDSLYTYNQLAYIALAMNEDSAAAQYIRTLESHFPLVDKSTPSVSGDYFYNRGVFAYRVFHPKEAEALLKRALGVYEDVYGGEHLKVAMCLTELGLLLYKFALSVDIAQPYILRAYEIFKYNYKLNEYNAASNLSMGLLSYSNWDYELADFYCENALSTLEKSINTDLILKARCLVIKGRVINKSLREEKDAFKKQQLKLKADSIFRQSIIAAKKSNSVWIQDILAELIVNDAKQNNDEGFLSHLRELELFSKIQSEHFGYSDRLKGYYYQAKKEYDISKYWYLTFWKRYHNDSLKDRRLISETCDALFESYKKSEQHDSCLYFLKEDLLLELPNQNNSLSWNKILTPNFYNKIRYPFANFNRVAETFLNDFNKTQNPQSLKQAFNIFKLTDKMIFSSIPSVDDDAVIFFKKEAVEIAYQNAIECAYKWYNNKKDISILNDASRFIERTKAFLLYRNMFEDKNIKDDTLKRIISNIRELSGSLNKSKWQRGMGKEKTLEIINKTEQYTKLYKQLEKNYPDIYKSRVQQTMPTIEEVQKEIEVNQACIQYSIVKNSLYILVISKNGVYFKKQENIRDINEKIIEFNGHLTNKEQITSSINSFKSVSYELYNLLFKPIEKNLIGIEEIIIIPDQTINSIPFEALINAPSGNNFKELSYLIYKHKYLDEPKILALSYDKSSKELPYSYEMEIIDSIFEGKAKILRGKECTANNLFSNQSQFNIIHLALHAASSSTSRQDNKIFFSPKNQDEMYGFELLKQPFLNELVILSACESGIGKTITGEGTFSLARYFLQSGVKNVIASLWKVDNDTYSKILSNFYRNILSEKNYSNSLNQGKIKYIKKADILKAHPKYWSGLIFID